MMCDIKKRANFARLVNYANNPKKARLIDSKDVRLDSNKTIAASMHGQADDKPGRKLSNPVYHISFKNTKWLSRFRRENEIYKIKMYSPIHNQRLQANITTKS